MTVRLCTFLFYVSRHNGFCVITFLTQRSLAPNKGWYRFLVLFPFLFPYKRLTTYKQGASAFVLEQYKNLLSNIQKIPLSPNNHLWIIWTCITIHSWIRQMNSINIVTHCSTTYIVICIFVDLNMLNMNFPVEFRRKFLIKTITYMFYVKVLTSIYTSLAIYCKKFTIIFHHFRCHIS